ncbi:hypothetical protein B0H10DRAFT_1824888 [Mycena sp. CBHHK59/15]|nr:hypothetical protein B0H10DRAFT_1824888 [Mycena sp. CBHHK59/15]
MAPKYRWGDPQGHRTITKIVKERIPQWKDGPYPSQHNLVRRVLDGEAILCCMATGGGKSALFAVPILILREMARNRHLYPDLPTRALPQGIVVTPTNGLAANIVHLRQGGILVGKERLIILLLTRGLIKTRYRP